MIALLLAVSLIAPGDTVSWLGSVLPDYGTFQYATVPTTPIGYSLRRIVTARTTPCTIVVHVTLRSPSSTSDIEDSVSLADLPSDSVTVMKEAGTTIRLSTPNDVAAALRSAIRQCSATTRQEMPRRGG